ncbi:MAG: TerD family protein [Alphaproteobacteria bacterium]|nr:TerD family protein [Alphaproteobacteria bacterium]
MSPLPPQKGETIPLRHTKQAKERVFVAIRWDEREDDVKFMKRLMSKDSQHDMDISCYIYNKQGEFLDFVGAEAQDSIDTTGKIYHSGDDMTGAGGGDDETICAELAELPEDVQTLVFLIEVKSHHVFSEVQAPYARLVDGMTNNVLLDMALDEPETKKTNAFVMCALNRTNRDDSGWTLHNVSEYPDVSLIENWGSYLAQFVD